MANRFKSFQSLTAATNAVATNTITGNPTIKLKGFSCKNNYGVSTNSAFTIRKGSATGPIAVFINLDANESRYDALDLDFEGNPIWVANLSGDVDISVHYDKGEG